MPLSSSGDPDMSSGSAGPTARPTQPQVVVETASYSASASDLSTLVTKLRRERPDVVYQVGYNPDITLFLCQA